MILMKLNYGSEKSKDIAVNYVIQEIESQWFYERRNEPDKKIIDLFNRTKDYADSLGLHYALYERAEHMMKFWTKDNQ